MKLSNKQTVNNSGQSLFELMMAVFVISMTLVTLLSLVSTSVSNSTFARDRSQAVRLTRAASEWVRSERDDNWNLLTSRASEAGTTYCLVDLSAWPTSGECTDGQLVSGTKFTREMTLIYDPDVDDTTVEARIVTTWEDSTGIHESRTITRLTNWLVI